MTARDIGESIGSSVRSFARRNPLSVLLALGVLTLIGVVRYDEVMTERYRASPAGQAEQARQRAEINAKVDKDMADFDRNMASDNVKRLLRDPSSAQFSGVTSYHDKEGELITCGLVNSRNGFGGMTGAQEFAVIGYGLPDLAEMG